MNKMADIQTKINEAMDSVLNITRATPKPFFYTRLEARLKANERNIWEELSKVITRPAYAAITLSLVLVLNVLAVVNGSENLEIQPQKSEMASIEDLANTSYYDIENVQP